MNDVIALFLKDGPAWLFSSLLLFMVFSLFVRILNVIKANTAAIAKFTEIVSHCDKNRR